MAIAYAVVLQPQVRQDLLDVSAYVANQLKNPSAAERLSDRLMQGIEPLSSFPSRCPLHVSSRRIKSEYRRLRIDNYLVFFTVSEEFETVTVARVLYARGSVDRWLH